MISLAQAARDMGATRSVETSGEEPMNDNKNFADKATRVPAKRSRRAARLRSNPPETRRKLFCG